MMLQFKFRVVVVGCVICLMSFRSAAAQDGFADDLTIPEGIEISDPVPFSSVPTPKAQDGFRDGILKSLQREDSKDVTITADLPNFTACFKDNRELCERYLASSPAWRVFEVRGARYATRRWRMADGWRYEPHGYYSTFDINWGEPNRLNPPDFQTRCTLGLSGRPWITFKRDVTEFAAAVPTEVQLTKRFDMQNSLSLITAGNVLVEIFEQTKKEDRSLTKTTLKIIESEADQIVGAKDWGVLVKLLPPGSIRQGVPEFQLCQPGEPGVFNSVAWVNPGEVGTTYVKAFEVTQGTPLSVAKLTRYANERVGWSDDPKELFFFNTHFSITEGDWEKPYAARF